MNYAIQPRWSCPGSLLLSCSSSMYMGCQASYKELLASVWVWSEGNNQCKPRMKSHQSRTICFEGGKVQNKQTPPHCSRLTQIVVYILAVTALTHPNVQCHCCTNSMSLPPPMYLLLLLGIACTLHKWSIWGGNISTPVQSLLWVDSNLSVTDLQVKKIAQLDANKNLDTEKYPIQLILRFSKKNYKLGFDFVVHADFKSWYSLTSAS